VRSQTSTSIGRDSVSARDTVFSSSLTHGPASRPSSLSTNFSFVIVVIRSTPLTMQEGFQIDVRRMLLHRELVEGFPEFYCQRLFV